MIPVNFCENIASLSKSKKATGLTFLHTKTKSMYATVCLPARPPACARDYLRRKESCSLQFGIQICYISAPFACVLVFIATG